MDGGIKGRQRLLARRRHIDLKAQLLKLFVDRGLGTKGKLIVGFNRAVWSVPNWTNRREPHTTYDSDEIERRSISYHGGGLCKWRKWWTEWLDDIQLPKAFSMRYCWPRKWSMQIGVRVVMELKQSFILKQERDIHGMILSRYDLLRQCYNTDIESVQSRQIWQSSKNLLPVLADKLQST